ncbi:MAG: IS481 family transposase [Alphaproteobacteria bacterium]
MPWREVSIMDARIEFVTLAKKEGANRRELCRRFGISAQTGYKWLARAREGDVSFEDRSRRPKRSPRKSSAAVEAAVLAIRDRNPAWGAHKIRRILKRTRKTVPASSTVHRILVRHQRIAPAAGACTALQRFEKAAPNQLWQMDFKGRVQLKRGWCHPLTVIDDHSRYALCLKACANEQTATVERALDGVFNRYGLPEAMYVDNGSPWGDGPYGSWTRFEVWLLKLGVDLLHSRPYHPQSRGKNERFHRTLKAEVFALNSFCDLVETQRAFDRWRHVYNHERPHQALDQEVPASRYRASPRRPSKQAIDIPYAPGEILRRVGARYSYVSFQGVLIKVPQALRGELLAIRPQATNGRYGVFFGAHQITEVDLNNPSR